MRFQQLPLWKTIFVHFSSVRESFNDFFFLKNRIQLAGAKTASEKDHDVNLQLLGIK